MIMFICWRKTSTASWLVYKKNLFYWQFRLIKEAEIWSVEIMDRKWHQGMNSIVWDKEVTKIRRWASSWTESHRVCQVKETEKIPERHRHRGLLKWFRFWQRLQWWEINKREAHPHFHLWCWQRQWHAHILHSLLQIQFGFNTFISVKESCYRLALNYWHSPSCQLSC